MTTGRHYARNHNVTVTNPITTKLPLTTPFITQCAGNQFEPISFLVLANSTPTGINSKKIIENTTPCICKNVEYAKELVLPL